MSGADAWKRAYVRLHCSGIGSLYTCLTPSNVHKKEVYIQLVYISQRAYVTKENNENGCNASRRQPMLPNTFDHPDARLDGITVHAVHAVRNLRFTRGMGDWGTGG